MKHHISRDGGTTTLHLSDQLVAADRAAFDAILPDLLGGSPRSITVDLFDLAFMDSAGLGMMLTLRERAEKASVTVSLARPRGAVKEMLDLACFDTLFAISPA